MELSHESFRKRQAAKIGKVTALAMPLKANKSLGFSLRNALFDSLRDALGQKIKENGSRR
jgi:hypothetical protein